MNKWQPIETAPKDGTHILVCVEKKYVYLVWWFDNPRGWCWDLTNTPMVGSPSHWMPLPEPPK